MQRILIIVLLFLSFKSQSQTKVYGTIKDQRNRILIGASITLKDTYDGSVTDSSGKYSFTTFEKGEFVIEIKSVGYKTVTQKITLPSTNAVNLNFSLREEVNELSAVTVTAGTFAASDRKRVSTVLNQTDMYTTAGSNADINAAIKTLPGAQQIGEQAGLFVRGGEGYETKEFIDGTLVNNPYNSALPNIQARSKFDPALFKGNIFSTGGYSALYGEALSSAFILETVDIAQRSEAEIGISPLFASAGMQHVNTKKTTSWGVAYSYTNVALYFNLVKQRPDFFKAPEFHSGEANYRTKTKSGGIIKYYTTFDYGNTGVRQPNVDSNGLKNSYGLQNTYWYNNLSWKENLGNGWNVNTGFSFSTNVDNITSQIQNQLNQPAYTGLMYIDSLNYKVKIKQNLTQLKTVFEKRLFGISKLRFGSEYWNAYNKINLITPIFIDSTVILRDNLTSLFGETEITFTNKFAMTAGVRFEYSSLLNKSNISPRIALAYKTGKNAQMSAAFGTFYQKPETYLLQSSTHLDFTKATHYLINYIKSNNKYTFRIEAYYKQYSKLVKSYPAYNNGGDGYARGVELFWRDWTTFKGIEYWISYSYLDTKRQYLYYPEQLQPTFATPHTLNVVAKKFITGIRTGFSFTYSFATGRPYYFMYPNGSKYSIGEQGTTKDYNQLDMSVYYVPQAMKTNAKQSWIIFASIKNVLNNYNIYSYQYSHNGLNKQAITASAPQVYFIGIFLTLGVDRTQDIINRNL